MAKKKKQRICDTCGGSGQISFFQGVSRFLLTTEECDACAGTGYSLVSPSDNERKNNTGRKKKEDIKK